RTPSRRRYAGAAAGWCWPTSQPKMDLHGMIRHGWPKRSHRSLSVGTARRGIRRDCRVRPMMATGGGSMAMTGVVKDELSRLSVVQPCCRKAEVSTLLRFAGGLHIVSGRIVIEAEIDTGSAARRLRRDLAEVFGHSSDVVVLAPSGLRKGNRYVVRVFRD